MKWIIEWQMGKDYGDALQEMQNPLENKAFYRVERKYSIIFALFILELLLHDFFLIVL
jgi:hypothetical protein